MNTLVALMQKNKKYKQLNLVQLTVKCSWYRYLQKSIKIKSFNSLTKMPYRHTHNIYLYVMLF